MSELWWIVTWCAWGLIIAAVVHLSDSNPSGAAIWLAAALVVGAVGEPILICLARLLNNAWTDLMCGEDVALLAEEGPAFEEAVQRRVFWAMPAMPAFVAIGIGPLWGGIIDLLLHVGGQVSASRGALYGIAGFIVLFAVCMAIGSAFMIPRQTKLPPGEAGRWRLVMVLSPLLTLPVLFYGVTRSVRRKN